MQVRSDVMISGLVVAVGLLTIGSADAAEPPPYSRIVYPGSDGRLVYVPGERGDVIPDYSHCGYLGGGIPLPDLPVRIALQAEPEIDDDRPRIQAAIDAVSDMAPDDSGRRGAVLLRRGTYHVHGTLRIAAGGVVLRGESDESDGTILVATQAAPHSVINVSGSGRTVEVRDSRRPITDDYVPVGARTFHVADASGLTVGDGVTVHRPSTAEWIASLGMDRLTQTYGNPRLSDWQPGQYDMHLRRRIVAITGTQITVDVPLVHSLDARVGGGSLYQHANDGQIRCAGVERLRIVSRFDRSKTRENPDDRDARAIRRFIDVDHARVGVEIGNARDAWVRNVTAQHVGYAAVQTGRESLFVTVMDVNHVDPVGPTAGGHKYSFNAGGQMGLFLRCHSRNSRHDFVLGSRVVGPNAFVDCWSEESISSSEPHHRYAVGCLWDNVRLAGKGQFLAVNRGDSGSGHGWAGANMVFWNCAASAVIVMQPPGAQNYAIGWTGPLDPGALGVEDRYAGILDWVRRRSTKLFQYEGLPIMGDGHIESPTRPVEPRSLYLKQLEDRLGPTALAAVAPTHSPPRP